MSSLFDTHILLTVNGHALANKLCSMGQPVTKFQRESMHGAAFELYIACRRRHLRWLLPIITKFDKRYSM